LLKDDTPIDSPRPQPIEGKEEEKIATKPTKEPSLEVVTKE
jgi:hypothetical protein